MTFQKAFSAAGAGDPELAHGEKPSLMVKTLSGSPSWIVVLQGSPNNADWTTIITHDSSTNASGETVWTGAERYPAGYWRLFCVSVSGGIVSALGWVHK